MPYLTHSQIDAAVTVLETLYPTMAKSYICPALCQDPSAALPIPLLMRYLRIEANPSPGSAAEKRRFLLVGGTHAREMAPPDAVLKFAERLLKHYARGTDFVAGGYRLPHADLKTVVDQSVIYILPLVNPAGRRFVEAGNPDWRKNRAATPVANVFGIDINRNFDFLWDFRRTFNPAATIDSSTDATRDDYVGTAAASENETKNVANLLMTEDIEVLVDVHAWAGLFFHPFAADSPQLGIAAQNYANAAFDGVRDGKFGAAYGEYFPTVRFRRHDQVVRKCKAAIAAASGRTYTVGAAINILSGYNAVPGSSIDFHVTRNMDRNLAFGMEAGFTDDGFSPDYLTEFPTVRNEINAALLETCFDVVTNGLGPPVPAAGAGTGGATPGGAPPGSGGSGGPGGSGAPGGSGGSVTPPGGGMYLGYSVPGTHLLLGSFLFGTIPVLATGPISLPAPVLSPALLGPAFAPAPSASHAMRLSTYRAHGGQTIRATLLDSSIDFTQLDLRWLRIEHVLTWSSGALAGLVLTVVTPAAVLGPRVLEYVAPPVAPLDPRGVPEGSYAVTFLYHPLGWWCDAERDLYLEP